MKFKNLFLKSIVKSNEPYNSNWYESLGLLIKKQQQRSPWTGEQVKAFRGYPVAKQFHSLPMSNSVKHLRGVIKILSSRNTIVVL